MQQKEWRPPSLPPSLGKEGETSKLTYVDDTQGLGVLCYQAGSHPLSKLQMPRERGVCKEGSQGRRGHFPELPRCLLVGPTEATLQDSKPAWEPYSPAQPGFRIAGLLRCCCQSDLAMSPSDVMSLSCIISRASFFGPEPSEALVPGGQFCGALSLCPPGLPCPHVPHGPKDHQAAPHSPTTHCPPRESQCNK